MISSRRTAPLLACFALASVAGLAGARSKTSIGHMHRGHFERHHGPFAMLDPTLGGARLPTAPARRTVPGSTIAIFEGDTLLVDADSGMLVRTDRDGHKRAEMLIGPSVAQLAVDQDRAQAYVASRSGDRIVVIDLSEGLRLVKSFSTRTEPFGLALSADGHMLLVTHVADQSLAAYETSSGHELWHLELGPEPRGVALADDASEAIVTFLTTGVVARIDLLTLGKPTTDWVAIDPPVRAASSRFAHRNFRGSHGVLGALERDSDTGRSFARNAFAAAYVGHRMAVVPHQVSTPHLPTAGDFVPVARGYGGGDGFTPPISHRLAFLQMPDATESAPVRTAFANTPVHQPRALAYDGTSDILYVAGHGSDDVMAIADVSQTSVHLAWSISIAAAGEPCGPSGLALDEADGSVVAFCSLSRTTVRVAANDGARHAAVVARSATLTQSRLSAAAQRGQALFRDGKNPRLSKHGTMACASCHAEARSDGLSWFLEGHRLQTPFLAGRLVGSHPFKWDGKDGTLQTSLTNTVVRLGGLGIKSQEARDLQAFLTSLEPPRPPVVTQPEAVTRGKALFESDRTGCVNCHFGPLLTDQKRHALAPDLGKVDTPSLVGLAHSAPYYHDGSASTLEALLRGNGSIHGMGRMSRLDEDEIHDLVAYMKTL